MSERRKDQDGHLHIARTNISKATVNPYRGAEIPGWQALGLDGERVYQMLRHPDELAKAAETFNNLRLLSKHVAVSADDPKEELVAGSTGTDAAFDGTYLTNSLVIWRAEDIEHVERGGKRQLSCAYYYDPDMTPGIYQDLRYDGVMRNLRGNHVALVEDGRAGPDVMVADAATSKEQLMPLTSRKAILAKGALTAYLRPLVIPGTKLAFDAALADITAKNWSAKKAELAKAVVTFAKPKLAKDATLDDIHSFLDRLDGEEDAEAMDDDMEAMDEDDDETEEEKKKREAKDRAKDKAKDKARDMKAKDKAKDAEPDDKDKKDDKAEDKAAMDAALTNLRNEMTAAAVAREEVRTIVGKIDMALDTADKIYGYVLKQHKIDTAGVHPSAYRAMVAMLPKPGAAAPRMATDSAATGMLAKFSNLSRIGQAA